MSVKVKEDSRVLSIQSHVVSGYVGNKSAAFPLQVLGFDVDTINSVQFSNHTGYSVFKGQVLNSTDLSDLYTGLKINNINHYSHLITGYIGSKSFLLGVKDVIVDLKAINPDLIYVCDPVMGDHGKLYVPDELLSVYKESILPLADIVTPNQFEAELLTGIKIHDIESARAAMNSIHSMGVKTVVISSSELGSNSVLVCLASYKAAGASTVLRVDIPQLPTEFTGTGDLFAALLLAWNHRYPNDLKLAIEKVISCMQMVLRRTFNYTLENTPNGCESTIASRELRLIQSRKDIENPSICVTATVLQ